jgi:hypothetical protein
MPPIVFAGHENEGIRSPNLGCKQFESLRRRTGRVLLEHAVKHRQANRLCIDEFDSGAARPKTGHNIIRETNAHAAGAVGTVEDENADSHKSLP